MIKFLSLSSGSSGNFYFFTDGKVSFLIDAGVGPRVCAKKLSENGFSLRQVDFILVTHDHIDHIKALGIISSKYSKPIYTTEILKNALLGSICSRGLSGANFHILVPGKEETVCGVKITSFEVSHDATQTLGYCLELDGKTITLVTDCGAMTDEILTYASRADALVIESNYDRRMLDDGPYPFILKERIRNGYGHLSNNQTAKALEDIFKVRSGSLRHIFLCHLSDNNNTPELALESALKALEKAGDSSKDTFLNALPRGKASPVYYI